MHYFVPITTAIGMDGRPDTKRVYRKREPCSGACISARAAGMEAGICKRGSRLKKAITITTRSVMQSDIFSNGIYYYADSMSIFQG